MDVEVAILLVVWFVGWPVVTLWVVNDVRKKEQKRRRRQAREFAESMLAMRKFRIDGYEIIDDVCRRLIG